MNHIVVIGGGVVGCALARKLSSYDVDVTVLEKGNDVSVGSSKANSGIVHAGFDAATGTKKAHYNVLGNAMFDQLSRELDFPFRRNGSMVVCFDESKKDGLKALYDRGVANGVEKLSILSGDEARKLEPYLSEKAVAVLLAETGGIVSPYEMTIAFAENAAVNGVKFAFGRKVVAIAKKAKGFEVSCENGEKYLADAVVNCAGVYSDEINNMVCKEKLHITARKGDYVLLDKTCGYLADHTLFQMPTHLGKGVLVTPTVHGNILMGPTAADTDDKTSVATDAAYLQEVIAKASLTVPTVSARMIITQFAGLRAHEDGDDFVVGESSVANFWNAAGIESPGLTAAPAIAEDLGSQIAERFGLSKKANFVAKRKGIPQFSALTDVERQKLIDADPAYGRVVCRCEMVTEGEIVSAIRRPVGATDLDGIKRRTRAGMGRCQSGFCTPRLMEILAREKSCDLADVTKCGGNSQIVKGRTK